MMLNEAIERWTACLQTQPTNDCHFGSIDGWLLSGLFLAALLITYAGRRLIRTAVTLPALALLPVFSRWLSNWVKSRDYTEEEFLCVDGAGELLDQTAQTGARSLGNFSSGAKSAVDHLGQCNPRKLFRPSLHRRQPRAVSVHACDARKIRSLFCGHGVARSEAANSRWAVDA